MVGPCTLYGVLQKAQPRWSNQDLLKVHEKLHKVSITDPVKLARAISEGYLNSALGSAGERKLKSSTVTKLKIVLREPLQNLEAEPSRPRKCFCSNCLSCGGCCSAKPEVRELPPLPQIMAKRPASLSGCKAAETLRMLGKNLVTGSMPVSLASTGLNKSFSDSMLRDKDKGPFRDMPISAVPSMDDVWAKQAAELVAATLSPRTLQGDRAASPLSRCSSGIFTVERMDYTPAASLSSFRGKTPNFSRGTGYAFDLFPPPLEEETKCCQGSPSSAAGTCWGAAECANIEPVDYKGTPGLEGASSCSFYSDNADFVRTGFEEYTEDEEDLPMDQIDLLVPKLPAGPVKPQPSSQAPAAAKRGTAATPLEVKRRQLHTFLVRAYG